MSVMGNNKGHLMSDQFMKNLNGRKALIGSLVILALTLYYVNIQIIYIPNEIPSKKPSENETIPEQHSLSAKLSLNTPGCQIPFLDPFHPSIRKLIKIQKPLNCGKPFSPPPILLDGSIKKPSLLLMKDVLKIYGSNITCTYVPVERKMENYFIERKRRIIHQSKTNIRDEFIKVECLNAKNNSIYVDFFPFIQIKPNVEKRCHNSNVSKERNKSQRFSVLLLGIDSASKNQYIRHLTKTDAFIRNHTTFIELFGYNKIGKNTYPNMIAMLTGNLDTEVIDTSKNFADSLPLIWKEFANVGYRTLYSEDKPSVTMFNYARRGFRNQPTDYYLRAFTLAVKASNVLKKSKKGCFNHRLEADVILNWTGDFFDAFPKEPLFAFTFLKRLSHDYLNEIGLHDDPFERFLRRLHDTGHLNRTIVFFFGDHGFRQGSIRRTFIGRIESKLPFMFILLPQWFPSTYPNLFANLKTNSQRLTTALDIHATLEGVLKFPQQLTFNSNQTQTRSMNLFTSVISDERTCNHASIPFQYCSCSHLQKEKTTNRQVVKAAHKLVEKINEITKIERDICSELQLDKIVEASAELVLLGELQKENASTNYHVTFQVRPSKGLFEGTVWHYVDRDEYIAHEDIERINLYGNQSYCINTAPLKPFCFCENNSNY